MAALPPRADHCMPGMCILSAGHAVMCIMLRDNRQARPGSGSCMAAPASKEDRVKDAELVQVARRAAQQCQAKKAKEAQQRREVGSVNGCLASSSCSVHAIMCIVFRGDQQTRPCSGNCMAASAARKAHVKDAEHVQEQAHWDAAYRQRKEEEERQREVGTVDGCLASSGCSVHAIMCIVLRGDRQARPCSGNCMAAFAARKAHVKDVEHVQLLAHLDAVD